ncbi:MAG: efflux RND transporter periplasmic adaptor subunit [Verrucomicrobiaceae bacterium]|nr:efflux RND transporter periplasmic adaptor subunit [Verrucomicrobiaceae bacterium]
MKKLIVILIIVVGVIAGLYFALDVESSEPIKYKTTQVMRGDVIRTIEATGTVEPEDLVDVGARVSGEIVSFGKDRAGKEIDFGSIVKEGDLMALIDDKIPQTNFQQAKANLQQAKANLAQSKASLLVSEAALRKAERDWQRAKALGVSEALSQATYDDYLSTWEKSVAEVESAKAKILAAEAAISHSEASLETAKRNLEYCVIKAPVDGVIISREVNVGQTVVSSMNASSLFLLAKDLKKMEVWASVNEADIANIKKGQPVEFTVDARPREKFKGTVGKVRLNATMSQNVVTYVVEVLTDNSDGRLLPYLTANLNFEVERVNDTIYVPNAALRWRPSAQEEVVDGVDLATLPRGRRVWVSAGEGKVRPIDVKVLLNNDTVSAIEASDLKDGTDVIIGVEQVVKNKSSGSSNPFMPKMPTRQKSTNSAKAPK